MDIVNIVLFNVLRTDLLCNVFMEHKDDVVWCVKMISDLGRKCGV